MLQQSIDGAMVFNDDVYYDTIKHRTTGELKKLKRTSGSG